MSQKRFAKIYGLGGTGVDWVNFSVRAQFDRTGPAFVAEPIVRHSNRRVFLLNKRE